MSTETARVRAPSPSAATAPAYTLPGWAYTDPDVFECERQAIHFRAWHYAGTIQELTEPGSYLTARLLDQNIIVMRGRDGALRGFYNVCQHRAHELLRGRGCVQAIVCPYHAWTYGIDGRFRGGRGATQPKGFDPDALSLKPVRVEVLAERFVFFNLDPRASSLAQQAGDLGRELQAEVPDWERLVLAPPPGSAEIRANWKVTVDNYLECYHCRVAHPAFAELADLGSFRVATHDYWMSHKAGLGRADNSPYPVSPDARSNRVLFWWFWPTTTFNVLPGSSEVSVFSFMPTSVGTTLQQGQRFALPEGERTAADEARERYRNGPLTDEDVALVESVQRGLASRGYTAGRFVDDPAGGEISEQAVHHFHRLVADALDLS